MVNPLAISRELQELNYEADQFMKTTEAARSEVLKVMSDAKQTKTGLKVIDMRWVVAKRLEDAAKAAESLALAEIRALSSNDSSQEKQVKKLVLRDDLEVGRNEERGCNADGGGRQRVSLNQMLRRHRGEVTPPKRRAKEGNEGKTGFFSKRKGLEFVHISLPLSN
ncbi:Protein WEAK CHLOROPLAST MOVEMENT UNDER BLUE LIGHT 1 [Bienertia sinuspersici]